MSVRILLADDHPITRQGVKAILATRRDLEVCCEATNGAEALEGVLKHKPDIAVLDVSMPVMSGFAAAEAIALMNLEVHVLLYTMYYSEHLLRQARKLGVQGYVSKSNAAKELLQAIDTLIAGKTYFGVESSNKAGQNAGRRPLVL
jgi:two-component system nitrate/nitrite response regulator NarL